MDNPNAKCTLRRRTSLPSKYGIHTTSLLVKSRLQKTNPYVGSFRHSPPSTFRSCFLGTTMTCTTSKSVNVRANIRIRSSPLSSKAQKRSPYVGWFRHAPPSFRQNSQNYNNTNNGRSSAISKTNAIDQNEMLLEHCRQLALIVASASVTAIHHSKSPRLTKDGFLPLLELVDGRLLGGGKDYMHPQHHKATSSLAQTNDSVLARFGSWLVQDASAPSPATSTSRNQQRSLGPLQRINEYEDDSLNPPDYTESEREDDDYDDDYDYDYDGHNPQSADDCCDAGSDCSSLSDDGDEKETGDGISSIYLSSSRSAEDGTSLVKPQTSSSSPSTPLASIAKSERFDLSLSEIAKTCYPDQATQHIAALPSSGNDHADASKSSDGNQLDYVISQMDIARMARNASRHLDVDSILKLPTITYTQTEQQTSSSMSTTVSTSISSSHAAPPPSLNSPSTRNDVATDHSYEQISPRARQSETTSATRAAASSPSGRSVLVSSSMLPTVATIPEDEPSSRESWSWMMVSSDKAPHEAITKTKTEDGGQIIISEGMPLDDAPPSAGAATSTIQHDATSPFVSNGAGCVICMETFSHGDRLRVLPCDHLFHVGCIDKWLAGSHSFDECYTSGCPTCKKEASAMCLPIHDPMQDSTCSDGSVPSWAFARLGQILAKQASSLHS